ncbi:MAG TPA: hypothetical protein PKI93_07860 [Alphaproteobacteria bacterium]|nr:hypothetical protein [Alphaproteobacteria bacterium]HNS45426.1 hypothetical protein [Alphaproteobacteria bacterium]
MQKNTPTSQSGNILFLILIAVALFAALSFAVSQSMRGSGSGGTTEEKGRIDSAYLQQFPTSIRQAIVRMRISNTLKPEDVSFAHPGSVTYGVFGTTPSHEVFHPQGGATVYQAPPNEINDGSDWIFNGDIEVANLGTTNGTSSSSELVAFLPGVRLDICRYLNQGLTGTLADPPTVTIAGETNTFTGTFGYAATLTDPALDGKDTFCYYSGTLGKYVFYQVLIPR